ncbi:MAG: PLP-dependent aminotransferase family protein [Lachnospiraceae bacterium]
MKEILIRLHGKKAKYIQIYEYFRHAIEINEISEGERLPSIRSLSNMLGVSKITVQKAYDQLCSEGYVDNAQRKRFTAASLGVSQLQWPQDTVREKAPIMEEEAGQTTEPPLKFDLSTGIMDAGGFDFAIWKKYIGRALQESEVLMRYGQIQGEESLRYEIAAYCRQSRGVDVEPEQIVIGASTQNLLQILCGLLKNEKNVIAFENPGFKNGRQIFEDHKFSVIPVRMQTDGISMEELEASGAGIVYVSPSHQFPTGRIMSIGKRNTLLNWAKYSSAYVIEDDYDSEFRYYGNPIPALKGLDRYERVIYLGSFSKILPPSIRISYMILPRTLLAVYREKKRLYTQEASTLEQLTLALYMGDGQLSRQIRRLRKLYFEKRTIFIKALRDIFQEAIEIEDTGSGLFVIVSIESTVDAHSLREMAKRHGLKVALMQDFMLETDSSEKSEKLILYFSGIPCELIYDTLEELKEVWDVSV